MRICIFYFPIISESSFPTAHFCQFYILFFKQLISYLRQQNLHPETELFTNNYKTTDTTVYFLKCDCGRWNELLQNKQIILCEMTGKSRQSWRSHRKVNFFFMWVIQSDLTATEGMTDKHVTFWLKSPDPVTFYWESPETLKRVLL